MVEVLILKIRKKTNVDNNIENIKSYFLNLKIKSNNISHIFGYCLLAYVLKHKYKKVNNFYIDYNEYGKPFIFGLENFHFNISHSGPYIVLGYANKDVGVDIEGVNHNNPRIVDRFFHKNEKEFIKSMKTIFFKKQSFLRLWTLKESYLKAIGFGINYPLNNFSVVSNDRKIVSSLKNYSFKKYYISFKYKLSICSMENLFSKKLKYITYKKLIKASNEYSK